MNSENEKPKHQPIVPPRPNIFSCKSVGSALRLQFRYRKRNRAFGWRTQKAIVTELIARDVEVSEAHLSNIFAGKKSLESDSPILYNLFDILGFTDRESDHIRRLAEIETAGDLLEKSRKIKRLAGRKEFRTTYWGESDEGVVKRVFNLLPDRAAFTIMALADTDRFTTDPKQLARLAVEKITPAQARKALEKLIEFGFLKFDDEGRPTAQLKSIELAGGGERTDEALRLFYSNSLSAAAKSLANIPFALRRFGAIFYSINSTNLTHLLDLVDEVRYFLELALDREKDLESLVNLVRDLRKHFQSGGDLLSDDELKKKAAMIAGILSDSEKSEQVADMVVQILLCGFPAVYPPRDEP